MGGCIILGIFCEDVSFIEKVKFCNIILIVGGNDVWCVMFFEELVVNIEFFVLVLYYRFGVV